MSNKFFRLSAAVLLVVGALTLVACGSGNDTTDESEQSASEKEIQTTTVTDENYALAESEVIIAGYLKMIAAATGTDGMGVWLHNREGADPKDRTIMRINFDTLYSWSIIDLNEPVTLTMPETGGRYQSAWFTTDEHYNPMSIVKPGIYTITKEVVGRRYVSIAIRTQVNVADPTDMAIVHALQDQLKLEQKDRGAYVPSHHWDMEEILAMRAKYQEIAEKENMTMDGVFGKKGEVPLKEHNVGTAVGFGGLTPERAVYPLLFPESTDPQTLTLRDVPAGAFWSITIYDDEGYPQGDVYNLNSAIAVPNGDGSYTVHFGGDKDALNYMDTFAGWNIAMRIYEPTEAYFNGEWSMPELEPVQ